MNSESELVSLALALGAARTGGPLSRDERALIAAAHTEVPSSAVTAAAEAIHARTDPLGEAFLRLRDSATRRADGAVYTPSPIVAPMVQWIAKVDPVRVVDPGVGSGRFLLEVLRTNPSALGVGIDTDPIATLMTRANAAVLGFKNVLVLQQDYSKVRLSPVGGPTAFVGNPPYVRHHQISPEAKSYAKLLAASRGHSISGLAGLHALFFLYTAQLGRPGDVGAFVTSSEWLDVNYGQIVRNLLLDDLGGESLHIVEPKALPFEGTQTTAVISTFRIGERPASLRLQDVTELSELSELDTAGTPVVRERLLETRRWSGLLRTAERAPAGYIELGELCRVHRGTVTGANATWVRRAWADLPPAVLFRTVTRAKELFTAGAVLSDSDLLKMVIDLPADLDELDVADRRPVERFITAAKKAGVNKGYIASHRRAWWSVGLKTPAPILATYMARQSPAFVLNAAAARHINIAHGLYPRQDLTAHATERLAQALRIGTKLSHGRVYAGGLTKFEPREMERLLIPDLAMLSGYEPISSEMDAGSTDAGC